MMDSHASKFKMILHIFRFLKPDPMGQVNNHRVYLVFLSDYVSLKYDMIKTGA